MESLSENQVEIRLLELSDSLSMRKETVAWVWGVVARATECATAAGDAQGVVNVSALEICRLLVKEANDTPGGSVERILNDVGIKNSEDVGRIVFGLVEKGLVQGGEKESPSDFVGLFESNDVSKFMGDGEIRRKRIKPGSPYKIVMWLFYGTGVILVLGSYFGWVRGDIAWAGWLIGMAGFAMQFYRPSSDARS